MLSRQNQAIILWLLLINISLIKCNQQQLLNSPSPSTTATATATTTTSTNQKTTPINITNDPSNGVDDILKDTILLLDVLDEKLSVVKNRTPNAMMRDNLRALDGASEDDYHQHHHYQQQHQNHYGPNKPQPIELKKNQFPVSALTTHRLASDQELASRELDDETSIEEALVRLADGFASGRRSDHDAAAAANEPLIMAASSAGNNLNEHPRQPINHEDGPPGQIVPIGQGAVAAAAAAAAATLRGSTAGKDAADIIDASSWNLNQDQNDNANFATHRASKRARQLAFEDGNNYQLASDSTERHIKFTLDLMQSIFTSQSYTAKTNLIESFLISPLSIQMVLMMMHLGARGQTRREISNCLHLTNTTPSTSASASASNPIPPSSSLSNPDKSLIMMQQQQQQQIVGGTDLAGADSMGSKLKRRHQQQQQQMLHQQQVSSENVKQQSVSNAGNSNGKSQLQSRHQQQTSPSGQQQQISSSVAAAVASNVAAAATATATLGAGSGGSNPHELFSGAMRNLLKDPIVMKSLTSANQIFLQKNLPLSAQYEWAIKHYYAADVKLVDFQHQSYNSNEQPRNNNNKPHASSADHSTTMPNSTLPTSNSTLTLEHQYHQQRLNSRGGVDELLNGNSNNNNNIQQMINDWIERQTKGKISNFLSSPISTSTLMMAINVLYFKGDWQYKFDPSDTETDAWFTQANGKNVKIPMMVNRLPLAFAHDPAMKTSVIELPYKAQRLGLFLLLPDEVSGIFHTMQMLNSTSFANLISSMRKPLPGADQGASGINVRIPKFSIESSPRLSQILSQQLGLKSLFMPDVADLSGMFGPLAQSLPTTHLPHSKRPINGNSTNTQQQQQHTGDSSSNQQVPLQVGLDELLHKAVLQVDEQGSVAAASSATIVERVGLFNSNYFEADHPFLLFLMDKQTGLVLFSGAFAGNNNHETQQQRH